MTTSEKRTLQFMLMCLLFMIVMGMAYDALAQEATPEATAQPPVTEAPPDVVVNVESNDAQSGLTLIYLIVGAVLGGGTVWVISPRIRTSIENDKVLMDALERRYHKGNPATRAFIDKAMAEARSWIDFQQKLSDGVLNDGTRLE